MSDLNDEQFSLIKCFSSYPENDKFEVHYNGVGTLPMTAAPYHDLLLCQGNPAAQ